MARYIELDVAVAEIERLKKAEGWCQVGKDTADVYYARGFRFACERIKDALDTLEVEEVDLEKEIDRWQGCEAFPEGVGITPLPKAMEIVERTAKHFFELGMAVGNKAQKGE